MEWPSYKNQASAQIKPQPQPQPQQHGDVRCNTKTTPLLPAEESSGAAAPAPAAKGGRKRGKAAAAGNGAAAAAGHKDFKAEYAKSNRSKCRGCEETIVKGEVRLSKKDYESEDARKFGGLDRWHHIDCFAKLRSELQYFDTGANIPGADTLEKDDLEKVKKALPKIKDEDLPPEAKKPKKEPEDEKEEKELKAQTKKFFSLRDKLKQLSKKVHIELLERNGQRVPVGNSEVRRPYFLNVDLV